jgi:hypothetical protein
MGAAHVDRNIQPLVTMDPYRRVQEQHIARLDVTVDQPLGMQRLDASGDIHGYSHQRLQHGKKWTRKPRMTPPQ